MVKIEDGNISVENESLEDTMAEITELVVWACKHMNKQIGAHPLSAMAELNRQVVEEITGEER